MYLFLYTSWECLKFEISLNSKKWNRFLFDTNFNSEFNGPSKSLWKQMKREGFGGEEDSCDKIESLVRELDRRNKSLWWSDGALRTWWERNVLAQEKTSEGTQLRTIGKVLFKCRSIYRWLTTRKDDFIGLLEHLQIHTSEHP